MKTETAIRRQLRALERRERERANMGTRERAATRGVLHTLMWVLGEADTPPEVAVRLAQTEDVRERGDAMLREAVAS